MEEQKIIQDNPEIIVEGNFDRALKRFKDASASIVSEAKQRSRFETEREKKFKDGNRLQKRRMREFLRTLKDERKLQTGSTRLTHPQDDGIFLLTSKNQEDVAFSDPLAGDPVEVAPLAETSQNQSAKSEISPSNPSESPIANSSTNSAMPLSVFTPHPTAAREDRMNSLQICSSVILILEFQAYPRLYAMLKESYKKQPGFIFGRRKENETIAEVAARACEEKTTLALPSDIFVAMESFRDSDDEYIAVVCARSVSSEMISQMHPGIDTVTKVSVLSKPDIEQRAAKGLLGENHAVAWTVFKKFWGLVS